MTQVSAQAVQAQLDFMASRVKWAHGLGMRDVLDSQYDRYNGAVNLARIVGLITEEEWHRRLDALIPLMGAEEKSCG